MKFKDNYIYKKFKTFTDRILFSILNRFSKYFLSSQLYFSIKKKKKLLNFTEVIDRLIKKKNPIIFDIGSGTGESVFRFNFYFPDAIYHCFEPSRKSFEILKEKTKKLNNKFFLNNYAVGDKNETETFYESEKLDTSSFYLINEYHPWSKNIKKNFKFEKLNSNQYPVKIFTLDDYIAEKKIEKIDLIKIDTQLYEDKVLKGLKKSIENKIIDFIEVEIHFSSAYSKNYLSIYDIEEIIGKNYRLVSINYFDGVLNIFDDNQNMFTDFLYAKKSLINEK
jgi:FkbM family methyltransferase